MKVAHLRFVAFVSLIVVPGAVARAAAQSLPAAAPVATEVQQVRDELDRLRKEFEALRQQYELRISSLEQRVGGLAGPNATLTPPPLQGAPPPAPPQEPPPPPPQEPAPPPPPAQSVAGASKIFNPDIAVIANFVGVGGKNPMSEQPALSLREAEVSFQAAVDPYARADFFFAAGPEGVEIEEGFITFNSLPGSLLLKVGKMRASFGKVNATHAHLMPTADRPLVTENLVGGEEGISDSGVSLSKLIVNPLVFLEATGEVFTGRSEVFQTNQRSRLNYVGRLRAYRDLTEGTNLDVGASVAFGPTNLTEILGPTFAPEELDLSKRLIGVDATFRYRPLRRAIYRRFLARTELVWSRQDMPLSLHQSAFGLYAFGEYQFARRWYLGARYDQSQRVLDASLRDRGGSFFLTFWPSEFSQVRTQYRRTNYAEGVVANELLFQFRFGIGAHAAHVF
jgi:hypothetical protein